jgi:hypothetical protein
MPTSAEFEAKCKTAFGFTEQDWIDNLAGRMSDRQQAYWTKYYADQIVLFWGIAAACLVLAVVLPVVMIVSDLFAVIGCMALPIMLLGAALAVVFACHKHFCYYRLQSNLPITLTTFIGVGYYRRVFPYLYFSGYTIPLNIPQASALYPGEVYRLHVLPVGSPLLSLDMVQPIV